MNFALNATNPFVNNMMYGGNFVDVLFRHLMENGWEGITFMAILNFYMYLSLDKIKDLFKFANDKLGEYGKNILEYCGTFTYTKTKNYSVGLFDKIKKINIFVGKKDHLKEQNQDDINKVTVTLSANNKTDLMALGNFLLKNKNSLYDYCRENSDKYKTTEIYALPSSMLLKHDIDMNQSISKHINSEIDPDMIVRIVQNIDYTMICESDNKCALLKDVRIKIPEANYDISWSDFRRLARTLFTNHGEICFPSFSSSVAEWASCPDNFCNGYCTRILLYIYYTKNFQMFKKFYMFLAGKETFDFGGKKYKMMDCSDYPKNLLTDDNMKKFLKELDKYCENVMIPKLADRKKEIDKWIGENKHIFENIPNHIPALSIIFETKKKVRIQHCQDEA